MSDTSDNSQTELLTPSSSPMVTSKQPAITQHEVQSLENKEDTNDSNTEKNVSQGLSINDIHDKYSNVRRHY